MTIRGAVGVLCCAALLVGCSSEAEPRTLPPVASASPSPMVLPVPPEATPETAQGAAAFARHWIQVVEQALATGDATQLRALSDGGCGGCDNLIGAAEGGEEGETIRGAGFAVEFAEAPPLENEETIVALRYFRSAGELLNPDGTVAATVAPEGPIDAEMRLKRQADSWIVLGFRGTPA